MAACNTTALFHQHVAHSVRSTTLKHVAHSVRSTTLKHASYSIYVLQNVCFGSLYLFGWKHDQVFCLTTRNAHVVVHKLLRLQRKINWAFTHCDQQERKTDVRVVAAMTNLPTSQSFWGLRLQWSIYPRVKALDSWQVASKIAWNLTKG